MTWVFCCCCTICFVFCLFVLRWVFFVFCLFVFEGGQWLHLEKNRPRVRVAAPPPHPRAPELWGLNFGGGGGGWTLLWAQACIRDRENFSNACNSSTMIDMWLLFNTNISNLRTLRFYRLEFCIQQSRIRPYVTNRLIYVGSQTALEYGICMGSPMAL